MDLDNKKTNEFIINYMNRLNNDNAIKKEMLSNTKYIEWLEKFTSKHPSFSDDDWLYFPEKITKQDNDNINDLNLFYDVIDNYAEKNYIYPTKCDFGNYYNIKIGNIGYEIGILVGQGTIFFCNRKQLVNNIEYIDFNDIINNKKNDNVDIITNDLNDLSNMIIDLYKKGIPLDAIIESLDKTINFVKEKKHIKVLKK